MDAEIAASDGDGGAGEGGEGGVCLSARQKSILASSPPPPSLAPNGITNNHLEWNGRETTTTNRVCVSVREREESANLVCSL